MWYDVIHQKPSESHTFSAKVHVPRTSLWFNGHFPGNPVLPGIAQLGMVMDVIREACDGPIKITGVSRVRFKQMILPDDHLNVMVERPSTPTGAYAFRIIKDNELVCSGSMTVEAV